MGVDEYIEKKSGLNHNQLLVLAENNILTRDELADLSSEELIEILKDSSFEVNFTLQAVNDESIKVVQDAKFIGPVQRKRRR